MTEYRYRHAMTAALIADYLGEDMARAVVKAYGGVEIRTPRKPAGAVFDDLARTLGPDAAREFVEVFGGEHLYVAVTDKDAHDQRLAILLQMRREGMSFAQIARVYRGPPKRYTARYLRALVARCEETA